MPLTRIKSLGITDGTITGDDINSTFNLTGKTVTLPSGTGGKVLQVVSTTKTDTFSTSSTSFVDVTGLNLNITPSSTSSKILLICDVKLGVDAGVSSVKGRVKQTISGSDTYPYIGDAAGSRVRSSFGTYVNETGFMAQDASTVLLSPSTTSQITYTYQTIQQAAGTIYINRLEGDDDNTYVPRTASSITAIEIAG